MKKLLLLLLLGIASCEIRLPPECIIVGKTVSRSIDGACYYTVTSKYLDDYGYDSFDNFGGTVSSLYAPCDMYDIGDTIKLR